MANPALEIKSPQFENPLDATTKVVQLKHLVQQGQMGEAALQDRLMSQQNAAKLNDLYRSAMQPDGTINEDAITRGMAAQGMGSGIPKLQHERATTDEIKARAAKEKFDVTKRQLDAAGATLSSLLQDPAGVNHDKVISAVVGLVNDGMMDKERAVGLVRGLPGDMKALRDHLMQQGLKVMDASKRMEMLTPDFKTIDNGGAIQTGTIDKMTGKFTAGDAIKKVATPDSILTNQTHITTTGMTNRQSDTNNQRTVNASMLGVQETPTGLTVVNKSNGLSVPVKDMQGVQAQQAKSPLFLAQQRNQQMAAGITEAKRLIPIATNSGIGSLADRAVGFAGGTLPGGEEAGQLKTIAGWMTSNVPRMEGPQSDKDTLLYRQMAADVGDDTKPSSIRLKALETLEKLQKKYSAISESGAAISTHNNDVTKPGAPPAVKKPGNPVRPPLSAFGS